MHPTKSPIRKTEDSSSVTRLKSCEICDKNPSLYRCPRCFICTCSLQCCLAHKQKGCNGKRDRAAYCALENFTDSQLASDYFFLEEIIGCTQSGRRMLQKAGANNKRKVSGSNKNRRCNGDADEALTPTQPLLELTTRKTLPILASTSSVPSDADSWFAQCSYQQKQLVRQANERGCNLLLMAPGMERQKNNTTTYNPKQDVIAWKVEWVFHYRATAVQPVGDTEQPGRKDSEISSPETNELLTKVIVKDNRVLETVILKDQVIKHILQGRHKQSILKPLYSAATIKGCDFPQSAALATNLNHSAPQISPDQQETIGEFLLFMKKIPCSSVRPIYLPVDPNQTLQEALKGKNVIEYPTLEVVLPCDSSFFSSLVKEI